MFIDDSISTLSDVDVVRFVDWRAFLYGVEDGVVFVDDGEANF